MLEDYLQSAASQLIERASGLKGKLPRPPRQEFERLATQCCDGIDRAIRELTTLRDNAAWKKPENASVRLLEFRRIASNVDRLENEAVAPIVRSSKDEGAMVRLLYRMSNEIVYPIELPTVSMLSQNYFFIRTDFKLICIPLMETQFLLHLPDVYHELSHPLFRTQHDPRTKPWLDAFLLAKALIYDHPGSRLRRPKAHGRQMRSSSFSSSPGKTGPAAGWRRSSAISSDCFPSARHLPGPICIFMPRGAGRHSSCRNDGPAIPPMRPA